MSRKKKTTTILALAVVSLMLFSLATVFASPGGVSTLGDFVWYDENGNGVKDEGPEWGDSGIDGVLVNLYLDDGDVVFEPGADDSLEKSMTTGDNPGTTGTEHGWYDFTEIGDHLGWWVEIADSNFDHGGPLEGYEYTGENASNAYNGPEPRYVYIPDTLTDHNDADFPYTLKNIVAIGNLVWYDPDNDGKYEPGDGEQGINGIQVLLYRDANGNGIPEPDAADGSAIKTTTTAQMTLDGELHDGIYQFLDLTPSTPGDPTTNYFVAVLSSDLIAQGYGYSSTGYSSQPLSNEDTDDGHPLNTTGLQASSYGPQSIAASTYVVSNPFVVTKGGQNASIATDDWGDAVGYADISSYMTVDFGFTPGPNAVTLTTMGGEDHTILWGLGMMFFGVVGGAGAFAWRRHS